MDALNRQLRVDRGSGGTVRSECVVHGPPLAILSGATRASSD